MVEDELEKDREVERFPGKTKCCSAFSHILMLGVASIKQAWSVGIPNQLLVRSHTCCCSACLAMDFENCNIKVGNTLCPS